MDQPQQFEAPSTPVMPEMPFVSSTPPPSGHGKFIAVAVVIAILALGSGAYAYYRHQQPVPTISKVHCGYVNVSIENLQATGHIAEGDITCLQDKIRKCEVGDGTANINSGDSSGSITFKVLGGNPQSCKIQMQIKADNPSADSDINWECQSPVSAWELINIDSKWGISITGKSLKATQGYCTDLKTGLKIDNETGTSPESTTSTPTVTTSQTITTKTWHPVDLFPYPGAYKSFTIKGEQFRVNWKVTGYTNTKLPEIDYRIYVADGSNASSPNSGCSTSNKKGTEPGGTIEGSDICNKIGKFYIVPLTFSTFSFTVEEYY